MFYLMIDQVPARQYAHGSVGRFAIGVATSPDGATWSRLGEGPIVQGQEPAAVPSILLGTCTPLCRKGMASMEACGSIQARALLLLMQAHLEHGTSAARATPVSSSTPTVACCTCCIRAAPMQGLAWLSWRSRATLGAGAKLVLPQPEPYSMKLLPGRPLCVCDIQVAQPEYCSCPQLTALSMKRTLICALEQNGENKIMVKIATAKLSFNLVSHEVLQCMHKSLCMFRVI